MATSNWRGKLTVTVHNAHQLANKELIGKMNPYVKITIDGNKEHFHSKDIRGGHQTPSWEQGFIFNLEGNEDLFHINVWTKGTITDDHIGRCDLKLEHLDLSGKPHQYELRDRDNFTKLAGYINISLVFDGTGVPTGTLAYTTHQSRVAPATQQPATPAPAPAPVVVEVVSAGAQPAAVVVAPAPVPAQPSPVPVATTTIVPPMTSTVPPYNPPPAQLQPYGQQPQQPYPQQPYQQPYQPQPGPYPVYQQPTGVVYGAPPPQVVYSAPPPQQIVYQQPGVVYQPAPQVIYQQPPPQVVYTTQQPIYRPY